MTVGRLNLTVFSSALFCFGTFVATPSHALPQSPWYQAAVERFLRVVHNEIQTGQPAPSEKLLDQPYASRITREDNTITLKGDVPTDSDLKIVQGVAAATAPGATFVDKGKVNPNVPDRDGWLTSMTFALRQLGKLEHGTVLMRNGFIAIDGVTKAGDDFAAVQKKLRDEAPKGAILEVSLKPHDVHPFVWFAQLQPGTLILSGHVPDKQDQILCNYAQSLFQNLKVNNSMEFAKGEPRDWIAATQISLDMLSVLYAGSVAVSDNVVRVEGIYSSPAMVPLLKSYIQKLPPGYKVETNILEPVARAPIARAEDVNLASHSASATLNP